jgi:hypothetical protein
MTDNLTPEQIEQLAQSVAMSSAMTEPDRLTVDELLRRLASSRRRAPRSVERPCRPALLAMAPEVEYEVAMVQAGRLFIHAHHTGDPIQPMTMNLIVESALVHLRWRRARLPAREDQTRGVV